MRYIYRLISQWMDEREKKLMGKCQPEWRRDPLRSSFPDQLFGFFSKDSCLLNYSRGGRWHCKTIGPQVKNQAKSNILQINFCTWGGGPGTILTVRAPPGVILSYKDQGLGKSGKEGKALGLPWYVLHVCTMVSMGIEPRLTIGFRKLFSSDSMAYDLSARIKWMARCWSCTFNFPVHLSQTRKIYTHTHAHMLNPKHHIIVWLLDNSFHKPAGGGGWRLLRQTLTYSILKFKPSKHKICIWKKLEGLSSPEFYTTSEIPW